MIFERRKYKRGRKHLILWESMEHQNDLAASKAIIRYEDDVLFYMIISGVFPMDIHTLIREKFNLELYYDITNI